MRCFSVWHYPCVHGLPQGGKIGICHHLEIGTMNEKFLENLVSSLIDFLQ